MRISEKSIQDVFKYIKDITTSINHFGEITCIGNGTEIELYFEENSYYILFASLKGDNLFINWGKDKQFKFPLEKLKAVSKCLKKNILAVETEDNSFSFCMDENDSEVKVTLSIDETEITNKTKKEKILTQLTKNKEISIDLLNGDVFQLFLDSNNEISETPTEEKLIEIPTKKIYSIVKNCTKLSIAYGEKEREFRYISLESENDLLRLTEILAVI